MQTDPETADMVYVCVLQERESGSRHSGRTGLSEIWALLVQIAIARTGV